MSEVNIAIVNLGAGEVVLDLPPNDLYPVGEARIDKPRTPSSRNLRLLDNLASVRSGYSELGTAPNAHPVTGLFYALFDDGVSAVVRASRTKLYSFSAGSYTDRSGAATFTNVTDNDYWAFASVLRTGSVSPKNQIFASDTRNELKTWISTGNFADVTGSPEGAMTICSFLDRCFVGNVKDGSGNRKHSRIQRSIVGDPATWTGTGSGFVDLTSDPYPISVLSVMGGGQVVLKGDANGGALMRGTPTGLVNEPIRYSPMNPGAGVGILLRRSFLLLAPGVAFFVGHDGLYLWDGITGIKRVAEGLVRTLLNRIEQDALAAAHAWYKHQTSEIHIAIPTTGNTVPDEVWVYNLRRNRTYGPYEYAHKLTSSAPYIDSGALTWGDLSGYSAWSDLPYSTWGEIVGARGRLTVGVGADNGSLYNDTDDVADTDAGVAIDGAYTTGTIRAEGQVVRDARGQARRLNAFEMLTVQDITIEYKCNLAWTPSVEISTDEGNSWTAVSDGVQLAACGTGVIARKTYSPQINGARITVRVSSNDNRFDLHAIYLRCTHAGDERHG